MVLSLAGGDGTPAVASRSPLLVGEVLIEAGAENSPRLPLTASLLSLGLNAPEKEYDCLRTLNFSLLSPPPLADKRGFTIFIYLLRN